MKMFSRDELIQRAEAATELKRRFDEERIRFYTPCSPKHLAFHQCQKPIRIFFGGNRSGKTTAGVTELIYRACFTQHRFTGEKLQVPGRFRIFTEKYQLVETFILPLLRTWVPKKWLRGKSWETAYDSRNHLLHGANGSIIDIMTYDQTVAGAASVELDFVWADEEMPQRLFSETMTRLISRKGKMALTVTPMYSMTWAMQYWNKTDDPNIGIFKVSIHDNPNLPEKEKQAIIANWPEHERKAREEGQFMEFDGLVYVELDNQVHFIPESRNPAPNYPVICTVDPHQRKGTYVTWAYVDEHNTVVFFDEALVKGTAKDAVEYINAREARHGARTLLRLIDPAANKQVSGYGSARTTLREFSDAGMSFSLADNSEGGYNVVHEYLKFDKSKPVDSFNHPQCYFTKDVPQTWYAMSNFMWDEWAHGNTLRDEKERPRDYLKDFPDCVRYTLAVRPTYTQNTSPVRLNNPERDVLSKSRIEELGLILPPLNLPINIVR